MILDWLKQNWVWVVCGVAVLLIWGLPFIKKKLAEAKLDPSKIDDKLAPVKEGRDYRLYLQECCMKIRDEFQISGFGDEVELIDTKIAPKINSIKNNG